MAKNNPLETIFETQNKMMASWTDYSKTMMDAFKEPEKAAQPGRELFTEWYEKQSEIMGKAMQPASPQDMLTHAADNYRQLMEVQLDFTQKWMDMNQAQLEKMGPKGFENWMGQMGPGYGQMEQWMKQTSEMIRKQMGPFLPFSSIPRMESVTDAYQEMYKYWEPVMEAIRKGMPLGEEMNQWISPTVYQDLLNKLMDFNLPEAMKQMAEHASTLFQDYQHWVSEQTSGFTSHFPMDLGQNPMNSWMHLMQEVQQRVEKNYTPFTQMMNTGKQGHMMELVKEAQEEYLTYAMKGTELQLQLNEVAQKAMPEAIAFWQKQYQETETLPAYDAFFQTFVDVLEKHLISLFETEAYASLQNQLSVAGVNVKNRMERFMALVFEGAPFTLRGETAELAQEVAELRRKLRQLEKELAATRQPAPPSTAAKRSRTTKKSTPTQKSE